MNLVQAGQLTEDQAREYLENIRWPNGPKCPHCGAQNATRLRGEAARAGTLQCNEADCREQFTVTLGTVMEDTHIPLQKWVMAFHILCSSKKGVSALQLQRQLGLGSYRTAWHLCHRIRHAMRDEPKGPTLEGTVEVDETYVGGKPRKGGPKTKRGRGTKKAPVVALVERDGGIVVKSIGAVTAANLKGAIRENVQKESRIVTDEFRAYKGIGAEFEGGHGVVKHGAGEYIRGTDHTNTAESFFALLKRGLHGSFHHVSKKHLPRYCDEFSFRWARRKTTCSVSPALAHRLS
jgi:transposase-like protein